MPGGRPPKLQTIVATLDDGTKVTARDRIIQVLRLGGYVETAAATCGIDKTTIYEWLKVGAAANDAHHRQGTPLSKLTTHQRNCMEFSNAVAQAQALAEVDDLATLAELGAGGKHVQVQTTKRDKDGNVLEATTRTEVTQPNAAVLMWRLERRFPEKYGRRKVEISGPDGEAIPVEARIPALVALARARLGTTPVDARADDVPEVETEVEP
jgi:hypothetical protein